MARTLVSLPNADALSRGSSTLIVGQTYDLSTALAADNDFIELGNYDEFIGAAFIVSFDGATVASDSVVLQVVADAANGIKISDGTNITFDETAAEANATNAKLIVGKSTGGELVFKNTDGVLAYAYLTRIA